MLCSFQSIHNHTHKYKDTVNTDNPSKKKKKKKKIPNDGQQIQPQAKWS